MRNLLNRAFVAVVACGLFATFTVFGSVSPASAVGAILQTGATTGTVSAGTQFNGQIFTSGGDGGAVTFVTTSNNSPGGEIQVFTDGTIVTSGDVLAYDSLVPGTFTVSGTDSDLSGDSGTWTFTLTVNPAGGTISPISGYDDEPYGTTGPLYPQSLLGSGVTGSNGSITYTTVSSVSGISISPTGRVTITSSTLAAGAHLLSGTDTDAYGNNGTWTYELDIDAPLITTQLSPSSGNVLAGSTFTDQLAVTGNANPVTYTVTSANPAFSVSSSGAISAPNTLAAGSYTVSGTDTDTTYSGTWTYTLNVVAGGGFISQTSASTGSVKSGTAYSGQLATSGGVGTVTFSSPGTLDNLQVSSSGSLSAPANLLPGVYNISGTDSDAFTDTGTWSFQLTVQPAGGVIAQVNATKTATVPALVGYSGQLATTGDDGNGVTYVTLANSTNTDPFTDPNYGLLSVSSTGQISAGDLLLPGTYTASGTDSDASGNAGTWSFSLSVSPTGGSIVQNAMFQFGETGYGQSFLDFVSLHQITGQGGTVTYTTTSANPAFTVSSSGTVTAPGTLIPGTYTVSGTDSDPYGNSGTWTYSLLVDPVTGAAFTTSGSTSTPASTSFTGQLAPTTGFTFAPVTYTVTTSNPPFHVSSIGAVSVSSVQSPGPHTVSGTYLDSLGDSGAWTYTLNVSALTGQSFSASGSTTTVASLAFTDQLHVSLGLTASTVTYTVTSVSPSFFVSPSGAISVISTLASGTQSISGTYTDTYGDSGTWSYALSVSLLSPTVTVTPSPSTNVVFAQSGVSVSTSTSTVDSGAVSYTSGNTGVCTVDSTGNVSLVGVGSCTVTSDVAADSNNNAASGQTTFTVSQATPTVSLVSPSTATYGTATTLTAQASVPGAISFSVGGPAVCSAVSTSGGSNQATCSWTPSAANASTTVSLSFTPTDSTDYSSGTVTGTVDVGLANPTVTVTPSPSTNVVFAQSGVSVSTSTSTVDSGAVSYISGNTSVCTVDSSGNVSLVGVGSCTVTSDVAADSNNNAASGQTTFTVSQATPTVSLVSPSTATYGTATTLTAQASVPGAISFSVGGPAVCSAVSTSGGSNQATCSWTPSAANASTTISLSFTPTDSTDYSSATGSGAVDVSKAMPSTPNISNIPSGASVSDASFTATVTTNTAGAITVTSPTPSVCTASGLVVTYVDAGQCTLRAHDAASSNYLAADGSDQSFTIAHTAITPTGTNVPDSFTAGGSTAGQITFSDVTGAGTTTVTPVVNSGGDYVPPSGFSLGGSSSPVFYDVATTAGYTGPITVCLDYTSSTFPAGASPKLFHYTGGSWVDVTTSVDLENMKVCGTVSSLSPFALGLTTTISISNIPSVAKVGGSFTAALVTDGDGSTETVTSSTTSVCTVSGFVVSYVGVGTCTLNAHINAGTNYSAADGADQSFSVTSPGKSVYDTMTEGQSFCSTSGQYCAVLQLDGNFVLYGGVTPLWASGTGRTSDPNYHLVMQADGNVVIYTAANVPVWATNTWGQSVTNLMVTDDGVLELTGPSGVIWDCFGGKHVSPAPPAPASSASLLSTDGSLQQGQALVSGTGYRALLQLDGNFVVYNPSGKAIWADGRYGASSIVVQADGNLVAYSSIGHPLWATGTRAANSYLVMQDDGNLVLYSGAHALWSSMGG